MGLTRTMNFRTELAKEIMDYLSKNPDAADTLEAVTEWWLLEQKIEYESSKVKEALDELEENGLVKKIKGVDSRIYYKLSKD